MTERLDLHWLSDMRSKLPADDVLPRLSDESSAGFTSPTPLFTQRYIVINVIITYSQLLLFTANHCEEGITQPPNLSGMEKEYRLKCGDALRLGSKGRHGSFHLWINVWVAGKTV